MKWILLVLGGLAALALIVTAIGAMLPQAHVATRQAALPAAPDLVWRLLTGVDAFPSWRSDVDRIEHVPGEGGRTLWREHGRNGRITFARESADAPRRLVVRIADRDLPFGGTWTYELSAVPDGTRLTITERGEVYNPIFRFVSRFVFGHDATITRFMRDLAAQVQKEAGVR